MILSLPDPPWLNDVEVWHCLGFGLIVGISVTWQLGKLLDIEIAQCSAKANPTCSRP